MIRWTLVVLATAIVAWFLGQAIQRQRYPPAPRDPIADQPWGSGKNVFDCARGEPVQPLDPTLTPEQRARVLELLKQACR